MANGQLENSIKITRNGIAENNHDSFEDDFCVICNNVPINPCSSLCGCKYCWDCIESYLNGEDKCCPGQLHDCENQILNIENDILLDQSLTSRISRVIVKYPEQAGQFSDDLKRIQNRMISIKSNSNNCPYSHIGCRDNQPIDEEIDDHLTNQNLSHSKLLIDCIGSLKHELQSIKSEIRNFKNENKKLKKEIEIMKYDSERKEALISDLQRNDRMKTEQIDYMYQKFHQSDSESDETDYTYVDDRSDMSSVRTMSMARPRNTIQRSIHKINDKLDHFDRELWKIEDKLEIVTYGEFVWIINDFSLKINEARKSINTELYSDSFFSHKNGYKMCLRVDPIGISFGKGSHLAVYFCLMQGPFDNILSWPMKFDVTFALIDQSTCFVHTGRTARFDDHPDNFAWNKPTSDKKIGYGYHKFIELEELLNNPTIYQGDRIFVKCTVHTNS